MLQLTEGLNGRNITCDNFFTSRNLAAALKQRQMTIVGNDEKKKQKLSHSITVPKVVSIHWMKWLEHIVAKKK